MKAAFYRIQLFQRGFQFICLKKNCSLTDSKLKFLFVDYAVNTTVIRLGFVFQCSTLGNPCSGLQGGTKHPS